MHFQIHTFPRQNAIFVSVQYRKILHTYITLIYMLESVSHAIKSILLPFQIKDLKYPEGTTLRPCLHESEYASYLH